MGKNPLFARVPVAGGGQTTFFGESAAYINAIAADGKKSSPVLS
jgi:hypothetical protein